MMEYRKATLQDLERSWDKEIAENPEDSRYLRWKDQFISNNVSGAAVTFMIFDADEPVGQGTLLLSPDCKGTPKDLCLCDGKKNAYLNTLRIEEKYEGQGHVSRLMREMERYAKSLGKTRLTIGVEAAETRNLGIYLHWGFDIFVMSEVEDDTLILYYGKDI